jgi:hypothetical protein
MSFEKGPKFDWRALKQGDSIKIPEKYWQEEDEHTKMVGSDEMTVYKGQKRDSWQVWQIHEDDELVIVISGSRSIRIPASEIVEANS